MDLIEDGPGDNAHEYTVSEISGAVKKLIEGEFGRVRVRGEIGRVSRPASGHLYFDLKDDRAVMNAVSWKGQAARMSVRPEEGMEVIAIGRMTTFPGQSRYQLIVEDIVPAGAGALMAMLEKRKAALQAEGLFDPARKQPLPYLPQVIGVVTSPSGAVIRDILHRLRDRFPRHVLIWPVAVQGEKCAPEVTAAIAGLNALPKDGPVPRPDLIIVARGGGSMEDLWGFNEESVVRAAAASDIPLISAVGHETDTTLIDYAADQRAPTPTAAAEMAVPVRMELLAWAADQGARLDRALVQRTETRRQRLRDLGRALGRPDNLLAPARQRADLWAGRLGPALGSATMRKRALFNQSAGLMRPGLLARFIKDKRARIGDRARTLAPALKTRLERARDRYAPLASRLDPAFARLARDAARDLARQRAELLVLADRLAAAPLAIRQVAQARLVALDRTRQTLGYTETLRRGYAVIRGTEGVVTTKTQAEKSQTLEIEFADGRLAVAPGDASTKPRKPKTRPDPPDQGSLF